MPLEDEQNEQQTLQNTSSPATESSENCEALTETFSGLNEQQRSQDVSENVQLLPKQTRIIVGQDGVFSNMSQKPEKPEERPLEDVDPTNDIEPPPYDEVEEEEILPNYFDTSVTCISEDGEVLIEGFPVGDFPSFITNMFVSMAFDLLGFLLTMLFSTNHAAKFGSQAGLGITMMRFGLEFKLKTDGSNSLGGLDDPFNPNFDPEEV